MYQPGTSSADQSSREECVKTFEILEINNFTYVLYSRGPFPRVTNSDDCGIWHKSHFSRKPVLKRECSNYLLVRCHKRQIDFRAKNEHLMQHERLPL